MNFEEARKVLWFKNYPKTMGELVDEGYLPKSRLEWAAANAYVPRIKEAAQVILNSTLPKVDTKPDEKIVNAVELPISLEKARSTLWPFGSFKGQPMGSLLDSKQISIKDLGFAIDTAWDEKVRQAAIALSLVKLEQAVKEPIPDAGFVHVVSGGRSYAERQETRLTLIQGLLVGFAFGVLLFSFIASVINRSNQNAPHKTLWEVISTPTGLIAVVLVLGFIVLSYWLAGHVIDYITKRLDKVIEEYRFGHEGEELAVQAIVQALDGTWSLFRNVNIPGPKKGDSDIILVGPPGIWVLEVKNYRGEYRNVGQTWELKRGKQWKAASASPSQQASKNALTLKNFLKADNLNVFVEQAVVWVNVKSPLSIENPSVAVWRYDHLADELGNIWQGEKLSIADREKIRGKLSKLCERQKENH